MSSTGVTGTSPSLIPATAILATLLLDERHTFDQHSGQRIGLKKTLISHGGIAPQIQTYFQRLETRNYRVTSVVDDTHSPPRDKRLPLLLETGPGRDSGIEDGRQSSLSSFSEPYLQATLVHTEFSVYKHALLCAQFPVLGRNSRPNSTTSNVSSAHFNPQSPHLASSQSPRSFRFESEDDEDGSEDDYPIQTETLSAVVRSAFQLSEEKHLYYDKNIMEGLGWKAPAKVLVEELVSRLALLERNKHPYYQLQAFETRDAYNVWQQQDRICISELINKFWFFGLPSPASSLCKPSYWESMHEEYADLMHRLIRCDKNQAAGSCYLLSSASRRLLKEFGLRYGVGELYRRIVYLGYLAEQKNFESELYYVDHVNKKLAGLRDLLVFQQARFTIVRVEFDMLHETLTKLHNHCENWLQRLLQDTYSPQKVAFLANLLCSVLELKVKLTGRKQPPVERFMEQYLQESLKEAYHSQKLRLTTELNLNAYTVPVSAEMTNKLIINIRDEVTRCRQCYNDVFSRFHLDVTELATVTLYNHLMLDVLAVCKFAAEQAQGPSQIDQDLLALAYRLSQLDQEWRAYIPTHAQQWRQPVMAQTKRWLSHLTRDLMTMVLNSVNKDKFQMLEVFVESSRLLPNLSTMGPHLPQRICQSPRSAFNSFQARGQTSSVTSTPEVRMSSEAGDIVPDQHKMVIVAEVYATEVPQGTCQQISSASQTKQGGHEVVEQRGRAELKQFLLKNTEMIITKTTSEPDLEWFSCKESKDNKSQQNTFVHSETNVVGEHLQTNFVKEFESVAVPSCKRTATKMTDATRSSGIGFTSSQDSGVDKDRYGSQDESDLDSMHPELVCDGGRARRNRRGRGSLNDGKFIGHSRTCIGSEEPTHDLGICIEVDLVNDEDEMMTRSGSDNICVATDDDDDDDEVVVEQFWDAKSQTGEFVEDGRMQDVGTVATVVQNETKIEPKNVLNIAKPTNDLEKIYQYNDNKSTDGVDNLSTDSFISISAMEQSSTCIDEGHIDSAGASSRNNGITKNMQESSFKLLDANDTTHSSSDQRVTCDVSSNSNIMADIQETSAVASNYLIVSCTDKAAVDVHSQSGTPLDKAAVDVHSQSRTLLDKTAADFHSQSRAPLNTSNAIISGAPSPASNASADLSLKTTATVDQERCKVNAKINLGSSLLHSVTDLPPHIPTSVDQEITNICPKINSSSSLLQASKDLQSHLLHTSVLPHSHSTGHSPIPAQYSVTSHAQNIDNRISNNQLPEASTLPLSIPSMHSTPAQHTRHTSTKSLEDSITASLVLTDVEKEPHNLAVSSSIVDVLVMVQQMVSFVCELCLILCPLPGMQEPHVVGPAGRSHSAVLCSNRAKKMREELLNSITETLANTIGLYVQNLLAIDLCSTLRDDANRFLSRQITEDLEERKRLGQLGKCRHDRAGTDCNVYLRKNADLLCDAFEPITQEMCVRINNTWCLSCLVPCFQGLLPKGLLHHQIVQGSSELLDDLTFSLTPHGDVKYIGTIMETQVKLLAHKLNMFLCRGMEVLMSDEMSGCCMSARLQPITDCLTNHLTALNIWLYPPCYQLFANQLWQLMIENFESEVQHLVRYNEKADDQALLLLQGLTHLLEHLHHSGKGLSIDELVDPAEPVLQLLQLFTLSTKRLIQLHKKLYKERVISVGPSSRGLTDVMPRDKLQQMFKELHKKRKCFTGKHLRDWIIENCITQDQDGVGPVEQADDVAWRLLEMGVISPVTKSGNTPLINKQGEVNALHRLRADPVSLSSQSDTDFPPVTVHSITHSGYHYNEDSPTDQGSRKSQSRSRHSSTIAEKRRESDQSDVFPTVSQLDGITSPCSSDSDCSSSRSSTSTFCTFRPDHTHFYCFSDIDDEVFYGVATRVLSQTPSPLPSGDEASAGQGAQSQGFPSDSHLKMMSITPEFVLGIIYARRKKNQQAAKYVDGLPADIRSDVDEPVSAFWFCLSACP